MPDTPIAPAPQPPADESLRPALEALAAADPDMAAAYAACGLPPLRSSPPGFPGLVQIIAAQQVSAASARAILLRLKTLLPALEPAGFLALGEAGWRAAGLSRPKMRYLSVLAEDLVAGRLDLEAVAGLEDEAALAALVALKGLGRWSAEVYLLFSLGRADILPAGDLALQVAAQRLKRLPERPGEAAFRTLAEPWRPHRSAAARFLWHAYRHPGLPAV